MNDDLKMSDAALDRLKEFEGCELAAYLDPEGVPTIGYGHTLGVTHDDVKNGRTITEDEAAELLRDDVARHAAIVRIGVTRELRQGQFDALNDFAYNVGPGRKVGTNGPGDPGRDGLLSLRRRRPVLFAPAHECGRLRARR